MESTSVEQPEIELEKSSPIWIRISVATVATFALVWAIVALFPQTGTRTVFEAIVLLLVVIAAGETIRRTIFKSNVRWTIRPNGIRIDRSWTYGRRRTEFIESADIIEIMVLEDPTEDGFTSSILLRLAGRNIEFPPMSDNQRARRLQAEIATRLGVPLEQAASSR